MACNNANSLQLRCWIRLSKTQIIWGNVVFGNEVTFHASGEVNQRNVRIWGSENPSRQTYWTVLFIKQAITRDIYLDMCEQFAVQPDVMFQQDGAPLHWRLHVHEFLDISFLQKWIKCNASTKWPPQSQSITLWIFSCYVIKDRVYTSPVSDLDDLHRRIMDAIKLTPSLQRCLCAYGLR
ncbi:hypothetical protein PR048_011138 [Dryococelus australis]|uniref:Transposable element Tc3 transposase n=1 Tax=Dryococelus australis TaxID=614101 RepID=A0ABQ9HKT4_9NEOP|nr:hypothetical protein PR048_011138 [Dryococelus australis]